MSVAARRVARYHQAAVANKYSQRSVRARVEAFFLNNVGSRAVSLGQQHDFSPLSLPGEGC